MIKTKLSRHKINLVDIISILMAFWTTIASLLTIIIPSLAVRSIISILTLVSVILYISTKIKKIKIRILINVILMSLLCFYNTGWIIYSGCMVFAASVFLTIAISRNIYIAEKYFKYIYVIFFFYGISTIILMFDRHMYINVIVPLFSENASRLIKWYNSGCMAGLTDHYSTNAMLLVVGLMIAFCDMLSYKTKKNILKFLFFLLCLLLTGKRAHVLFFLIAAFIVYYLSLGSKKHSTRLIKLIGVVLALLIFVYLAIDFMPAISQSILRIKLLFDQGEDHSTTVRLELWNLALRQFEEHPIFGIGWKQFKDSISILRNTSYLFDVHNVYLQLLCETGIFGFITFSTWFVYNLYVAIGVYKKNISSNCNDKSKNLIALALMIQIFFLLYCFTGNPLYDKPMYIPYFASCGVILYYNKRYWKIKKDLKIIKP